MIFLCQYEQEPCKTSSSFPFTIHIEHVYVNMDLVFSYFVERIATMFLKYFNIYIWFIIYCFRFTMEMVLHGKTVTKNLSSNCITLLFRCYS